MLFNGIDLSQYFRIKDIRGRGLIKRNINTISIPGMDGEYVESVDTPSKILEVDIRIISDDLRKTIDELNAILATDEPVPIVFPDEPDMTYYGIVEASDETGERVHLGWHDATIYIRRSDPYKYGPEKPYEFQDSGIVENNGTAESYPIFELTAKEKATFAMISNGAEEYNLIGTPADDDVVVVDEKTSVLYENGSTLDTWTTPVTLDVVDSHFIDHIDGIMGTDGAGIRPQTWGTVGQKQHGAGALKELSQPIQDFEIETTFDIISEREVENWRMGIMLFDEFMNNIGMIGMKDNTRNYKRRTPLTRIGPYRGSGPSSGYLIGDADRYDNARDTTLFYLRFRREGKTFNAYIGEWRFQRHVRQWAGTYHDVANEYTGRLKYISLYITSYQDRVRPSRLRINSVEVFELTKAEVDQTPYIIYPGDVVEFDHVTKDIRLNGESRKDLKAFGGSFFTLKKGINTLTVTPENTFDTKITYQERYK